MATDLSLSGEPRRYEVGELLNLRAAEFTDKQIIHKLNQHPDLGNNQLLCEYHFANGALPSNWNWRRRSFHFW